MRKAPPLPPSAPVIHTPVMGHGRFMLDVRPAFGPYGWVYPWTIEDMDSSADDQVVRSGWVMDCPAASEVMNLDVCTALLGPDGAARTPPA